MQSANRPVERTAPRRRRNAQPTVAALEPRQLLAIDLAGIAGNVLGVNPPGPFGVLEAGQQTNGGVGWSTALVGDVNGDGFQDMVVGAPNIAPGTGASFPQLAQGAGRVFLVLGSNPANAPNTNVDWRNLTADGRIGDLAALGNLQQTNPVTNQPGFPYNGLVFTASQNSLNNLGASVAAAGDVNGDGLADFLIGAPGANDPLNANPGTGRAYLVYGSTALGARGNKQVDLDNTTGANADLRIVTFVNVGQTGSQTGMGVAGVGDVIADGFPDIAIGAPRATVTGLAGQGAVYLISGQALRQAQTATVALNTVGQNNGVAGLLLSGVAAGDQFGYSIAAAGNTTGRTTAANRSIGDMIIGSPGTPFVTGAGRAVLFYGDVPATLQGYTTTVGGLSVIPGSTLGTTVPAAIFNGSGAGDATGYAVSTAGDFNNDGLADILIGAPGNDATFPNAGRVTMIYGRAASPANPGAILGSFNLDTLPSTINFVEFQGSSTGALAGFSVTATGLINNDTINEIALGSPGAGVNGEAYLIPGNPDLSGVQPLAAIESAPIQGLTITSSAALTQTPGPYLIGTGVSGLPFATGTTLDSDSIGDLVVGGAGFALNTARGVAGGVWGLEGVFLPLPTPVSTAIQATIGIDQPFGPFIIDATQPDSLLIYVFSNANVQPQFVPPRDIDPASVVVNGVAFPGATITTDPVDENNDGLKDAIITISPRSALGLTRNSNSITVTGRTLQTSPQTGRRWSGQAAITVIGGGGTGGNPVNRLPLLGIGNPTTGVPAYGERFIPNPAVLSKLQWQRMSPHQRFQQYLPEQFFAGRYRRFYHGPYNNDGITQQSRKWDSGYGVTTLGRKVFSRGQYPAGVVDFRRAFGMPVRAGARLNRH